jgi:hypothetical protein
MKGGFWETITNAWQKTKESASNAYNSMAGTTPTQSTYVPAQPAAAPAPAPAYTTTSYGGKKRRTMRRKRMRGGYTDNISLSNLASNAASFTGVTAQPHTWVGGKTKRNRRRHHKKSRRN